MSLFWEVLNRNGDQLIVFHMYLTIYRTTTINYWPKQVYPVSEVHTYTSKNIRTSLKGYFNPEKYTI